MKIDDILEYIDMDELLQDLMPEDLGFYYKLACPKCGERDAMVYKDDNKILCMNSVCNLKESIFEYIMDKYDYTQKETLEYLKSLAGNISFNDKRRSSIYKTKEQIQSANIDLNKELVNNLTTNRHHKVWDFIRSRKYSDNDIESMGLGLDLRTSYSLTIPFHHPEKNLILGFYRRDITGNQDQKYKVSPELPVGKYFFNSNRIIEFLDEIIITEGMLDALLLTARGINNVIATAGHKITEDQKKQLLSYIKNGISKFYLFFDNDRAGHSLTIKAIRLIKDLGGLPIVLKYQEKDPAEFLKNPKNDFNKIKLNAVDGNEWLSLLESSEIRQVVKESVSSNKAFKYSIDDFLKELDQLPHGLKTGFPVLDKNINIPVKELTLIAGKSGNGKTSFLYNMLLNQLDLYSNKSICFFTYESNRINLIISLINILANTFIHGSGISNKENIINYLKDDLKTQKNPHIDKALDKIGSYLHEKRLIIADDKLCYEELKYRITELKNQNPNLIAVYIDPVQLIKSTVNIAIPRQMQLQIIISELLELANNNNLSIILSTQISECSELSFIGDFEYLKQFSSIVLELSNDINDEDKEAGEGADQIRLMIQKNRWNASGRVINYHFDGSKNLIIESGSIREI